MRHLYALFVVACVAGCASTEKTDEPASQPAASVRGVSRPLSGMSFTPQTGWVEETTTSSMRAAQFMLPGAAGADASLVVYYFGTGSAGSIDANIDRWCGQFEQPDGRDSNDVARIEQTTINGLEVHTVDLGGTYVAETRPGSGERLNEPDYHLLAAIVNTGAGPYYLKLVGPAATVKRWRASYEHMVNSLVPAPVIASNDDSRAHP